ncbi:MAG: glycosyltransferase family 39 protein [Gemmatimonadota bacterium]|nr:MAG: glycosyltransferase family 39 protein [Gemmatimonadota bacterium]
MSARNATILVVVLLTAVATPLRVVNLGALSFYADEETSAMPARSLAEGNGPRMPTGMEYRRALPLTWLNAGAARLVGVDADVAYRIPTAVFGILTVALFFLAVRSFGGSRAAWLAALMLAVSEWHLVFSRQSRMYVAFLLFFIAGAWAIWSWAETGKRRWLVVAIPMAVGAVTMHQLGLMIVMFAFLPLVLPGRAKSSAVGLVAFAILIALGGWAYNEYFVLAPYFAHPPPANAGSAPAAPPASSASVLLVSLGAIGGIATLSAATVTLRKEYTEATMLGRLSLVLAATTAGVLAWIGQIYGACLAVIFYLILLPGERSTLLQRARLPIALVAVPCVIWMVVSVLGNGLRGGIKAVSEFPYPYPLYLAQQFPVILLMFGGACLVLALRRANQSDRPLRAAVLAGLLPIVAVGAVSRWGGTRYLFAAYPFLLSVASVGLVSVIDAAAKRLPSWKPFGTLVVGTVVVLSGVLGGHGVYQAMRVVNLDHGQPVNEAVHMYPFRPDHASLGRFLREQRSQGDLVIAEDPLQQWWYAGDPIDYWLRSFADSRAFLYSTPTGELRDIYVGSQLLTSSPDSLLDMAAGRVWLVTSGETAGLRSYFLDTAQARWLDSLETATEPAFVGRDGISKVFCLNCPPR